MSQKLFLIFLLLIPGTSFSQKIVPLNDLSFFDVGKNWKIVGTVSADLEKDGVINSERGEGVLLNSPTEKRKSNLFTNFEHGDMDISFEFMMAKHSNSGIYLQGRYEVQLLDSWGVQRPKYSDCGGIYAGSNFEGHAPLINASKAPGTWQKMEISFQAPRFDDAGNKIENAKFISVKLNGYPIQENIELSGPTGGAIGEETAKGPLMVQGDHGAVALKNIEYTDFTGVKPELQDITYTYYEGEVNDVRDFNFDKTQMIESNKTSYIDLSMTEKESGWGVVFEGKINILDANNYTFYTQAGGQSQLFIDGKEAIAKEWTRTFRDPRAGQSIQLSEGLHDFKLIYGKTDGWLKNGLGLFVTSENLRMKALHKGLETPVAAGGSPIYADADKVKLVRSFSQFGESVLTRVIHVGSPNNLHFAYNLENGALLKIWKGDFLDLSPMLNGRGNGTTVPRGAVLALSNTPNIDSENYRSRGYDIDKDGFPIFRYESDNNKILEKVWSEEGKIIKREIAVEGSIDFNIQGDAKISKIGDNLYEVNNKEFFIRIDQGGEQVGFSNSQLSARISNSKLTYSILW